MKVQLRAWNMGVLVAALALGCANSRGMKLSSGSGSAAQAGAGGNSIPAEPAAPAAPAPAAEGSAGVAATVDAGMNHGPDANADAGMQNGSDASADAGMQNGSDASPAGALMIAFTTATNGRYAPHNAGAAWIETSSGVFVKTLERWAGVEARALTRWTMASGGWGNLFAMNPNPGDMMDAISRATLRMHETHELTWNLKDAHGAVVLDGPYQIVIEVVDSNDGSVSSVVPFQKGRDPVTFMPRDMPPYTGFTLVYQP
jgi:hypothetical protein